MSSRILVRKLAPHLLSTSTGAAAAGDAWTQALLKGAPARGAVVWARVFPVRMASTTAAAAAPGPGPGPAVEGAEEKSGGAAREAPASEKKAVTSYWGVEQRKLAKEDGTDWRWSCFRVIYRIIIITQFVFLNLVIISLIYFVSILPNIILFLKNFIIILTKKKKEEEIMRINFD